MLTGSARRRRNFSLFSTLSLSVMDSFFGVAHHASGWPEFSHHVQNAPGSLSAASSAP
ncbi:hypothetical protein ACGFMK_25995 [Amycolatopsis sp. NPDC049252]|uniref:hypothetical protein n=1 Tax=Amycolatopsis sp. NPDC049252 TaxID=3363933 RepID=UPI00371310C3